MSKDITLVAQKREVFGKKTNALRNSGLTPAVVHERGKDSLHIEVAALELKKAFAAAGKHHPIKLDVDGKKYTTIIKEIVNAPASNKILHSVFQAVKADEKVTAEIPLKLVGEIPAEKASLLVLKNLDHVTVEALPGDLIDVVEADASLLAEVGDRLHVSDLKLPANITLKNEPEQVIATVEMPKDQIAEADAALAEQAEQEGAPADGEEGSEAVEGDGQSAEAEQADAAPAEESKKD